MIKHINEHGTKCYCDEFDRDLECLVFYNGSEFCMFTYNSCLKESYDTFIEPVLNALKLEYTSNVLKDRVYDLNMYLKKARRLSEYTKDNFKLINYICKSGNKWGKVIYENVDISFYISNLSNIGRHHIKALEEIENNTAISNKLKNKILQDIDELVTLNYVLLDETEVIKSVDEITKLIKRKIKTK